MPKINNIDLIKFFYPHQKSSYSLIKLMEKLAYFINIIQYHSIKDK